MFRATAVLKVAFSDADCGALMYTNEEVRADLKKRLPDNKEIDSMEFGAIDK